MVTWYFVLLVPLAVGVGIALGLLFCGWIERKP